MRLLLPVYLFLLFVYSCSPTSVNTITENTSRLTAGTWDVQMDIGHGKHIPFRLEIVSDELFVIHNHKEKINISDISYSNDSVHFTMPIFDSEFKGKITSPLIINGQWTNNLRDDYSIPFAATHKAHVNHELPDLITPHKYHVTFSPGMKNDQYESVGLIEYRNNMSFGTFITETGDYRFLEGRKENQKLRLSCFDGSHLFLFEADMKGDSLVNGMFYSGKHYNEKWHAEVDSSFELSDPDSLTYLTSDSNTVSFSAQSKDNETIYFNTDFYKDKVTIVQIFGSWCPNCLDEHVYYKSLYEKHNNQGLQIVPIAFEKGETFVEQLSPVEKQFKALAIDYPYYIGGQPQKDAASEKFSMLNKVMSYPTSIIIDKKGEVRKIHTGFYGPSTGDYYTEYVKKTDEFITELLNE